MFPDVIVRFVLMTMKEISTLNKTLLKHNNSMHLMQTAGVVFDFQSVSCMLLFL
jgi:hypothetical protein